MWLAKPLQSISTTYNGNVDLSFKGKSGYSQLLTESKETGRVENPDT